MMSREKAFGLRVLIPTLWLALNVLDFSKTSLASSDFQDSSHPPTSKIPRILAVVDRLLWDVQWYVYTRLRGPLGSFGAQANPTGLPCGITFSLLSLEWNFV
jgi:hypothetical protein